MGAENTVLTITGCASALCAMLISLVWNMPLRGRITGGPIPPDYPRLQRKWSQGNLARTLLGVMSFGSYVLAAL